MSGFPLRNPTDASKFRQQYLANLTLQAQNDDINLQANKLYKKTGQTPAQMTDTRTTAEKQADIERLKIEVRKELQPIADGIQANQIVENLGEAELIYLANNISNIISILQPKYKLGILADVFLEFLRKSIAKDIETKGVEYGLQETTGKDILIGLQQIQQLVSPAVFADLQAEIRQDARLLNRDLYNDIEQNINLVKMMIPDRNFLTALSQIQDTITRATIQSQMSGALENLPTSKEVVVILKKLQTASARGDATRINQLGAELNALLAQDPSARIQMDAVYKAVQDAMPTAGIVNPFDAGAVVQPLQAPPAQKGAYAKALQAQPQSPVTISIPSPLDAADFTPSKLTNISKIYQSTDALLNSQKTPDQLLADYITPLIDATKDRSGKNTITQSKLGMRKKTAQSIRNGIVVLNYLIEPLLSVPSTTGPYLPPISPASPLTPVNMPLGAPTPAKASSATATFQQQLPISVVKRPKFQQLSPIQQQTQQTLAVAGGKQAGGAQGRGIRGCGLSKKSIKINTEEGIKPQDEYVSLGRYYINKPKLNKNIVSVRTKNGYSAKLPVRRVSNNLSSVVKNIVGGGMPTTEDLDKLTDDEKNYLHKLSKQSNILDRLSIPTPNKNQLDKDINEFEIMKGQILNGNDNTQYIKKFKLLIVKLINQDVLPRNEGKDILIDLASLGY